MITQAFCDGIVKPCATEPLIHLEAAVLLWRTLLNDLRYAFEVRSHIMSLLGEIASSGVKTISDSMHELGTFVRFPLDTLQRGLICLV